jgi:hypothetical protein
LHTEYQFNILDFVNQNPKFNNEYYKSFNIIEMITKIHDHLFNYCHVNKSKNIICKLRKDKYDNHVEFFEYIFELMISS